MLLHVFGGQHRNAIFQNKPGRPNFFLCNFEKLSDLLVLHYTDIVNLYLNMSI